jgi:hypothetical protein
MKSRAQNQRSAARRPQRQPGKERAADAAAAANSSTGHREPDDGKPSIAVTWVNPDLIGRATQHNGLVMTDIWPAAWRSRQADRPEPELDREAEP